MNKSTFILILFFTFLPITAYAQPPDSVRPVSPVEIANDTEYRLIGFTTTTTNGLVTKPDGSSAYLAMHRYCQEEVDPDSRACFASEASGPSGVPVLAGDAWVIRSRDVTVLLDDTPKFVAVDTGSGCVSSRTGLTAAVGNLDC